MNKHVIELNGKKYDAMSGKLIVDVAAPQAAPVKVKAPERTAEPVRSAAAKPSRRITVHNHANARKTQPSGTLMRHAVRKPAAGLKRTVHVQTALSKQPIAIVVTKPSVNSISPSRLNRAKTVSQSQHVSKFHAKTSVPVTFGPVPVRHEPPSNEPEVTAAPPPTPTNAPSPDIFEQAVANASHFIDSASHKDRFRKHTRAHLTSMAAGALGLLLIAGFATYQNSPGLQLKVAGVRAGIATSSPNFAAAGFSYNGARTEAGKRITGLKAGAARYQLTEQATNWSGGEMVKQLASVRANGMPNYQTLFVGGNTLYRFSDGQVTWVKDGTWYQLQGSRPLTDDQLKALVQNS